MKKKQMAYQFGAPFVLIYYQDEADNQDVMSMLIKVTLSGPQSCPLVTSKGNFKEPKGQLLICVYCSASL